MKNIIFEKEYSVNSINININKHLGLFGMLGILQDVSTIHAEQLGLGFEYMEKNNSFWVLTQQKLKMNTWPKWQDVLTIKTWPRGSDGLKANRDFEILLKGKKIGECVTTYMVIDGHTRRPVRADLGEEIEKSCPKDVLELSPEKVRVPEEATLEKSIEVRNSDLDMNNHVNNTKYSQWILDTIPIHYHRSVNLLEFDINFISEARLGDHIDIYVIDDELISTPHLGSYYKGIRQSDGKLVFTAKVLAQEI